MPPSEDFNPLKALCIERGVEMNSIRQMCWGLGIKFSLDTHQAVKIDIPHHLLRDDYLARGRLSAQLESFTPQIREWLTQEDKMQDSADKTTDNVLEADDDYTDLPLPYTEEEKVLKQEIPLKQNPTHTPAYWTEKTKSLEFPIAWEVVFIKLLTRSKPFALAQPKWESLLTQIYQWLEKDALQLQELIESGWTSLDIFGCHPISPQNRYESIGLILLLQGRTIFEVTRDCIVLKTASGANQSYRRPSIQPSEQITIDDLP